MSPIDMSGGRFGRQGNLGTIALWNCPACGGRNEGRRIEQGCGVCGAGDPAMTPPALARVVPAVATPLAPPPAVELPEAGAEPTHLGAGVYVAWDGDALVVSTNQGDVVRLERVVYTALTHYVEQANTPKVAEEE